LGRIFRTHFESEQVDLESFLNFFISYLMLIRESSFTVGRYSADVIRQHVEQMVKLHATFTETITILKRGSFSVPVPGRVGGDRNAGHMAEY
jgi:hypothetical protein